MMQVDVETIGSSFGGGWAVPRTEAGRAALVQFYSEAPAPLAPLGGDAGYIVEPQDCDELVDHLRTAGATFGQGE